MLFIQIIDKATLVIPEVAGKVAEVAGNVALAEGAEPEDMDRIYSVSPPTVSVSQSVSQSAAVAASVLDGERMTLPVAETETKTRKEGEVQSGSDTV